MFEVMEIVEAVLALRPLQSNGGGAGDGGSFGNECGGVGEVVIVSYSIGSYSHSYSVKL